MKKRYNTYNPYARLPKAETGMNVRGPRNQLAKQVSAEKNVGTWFKDAGKWLLNTLVSPIEGMTQTNFYDPNFSHGGWEGFNDVFEGTHKGVGDALGYVYGGPMHAATKESGKGMMDAFGVEEQTRAVYKNGGRVLKAQNSINTDEVNNLNSFKFQYDNTDPRMVNFDKDLQNWITTTYPMAGQGTPGSTPHTYSVSGPDQGGVTPQGGSCVGGGCAGGGVKYASGMTKAEMANQGATKPIKSPAPMLGDGVSRASNEHVQKWGNPYASDHTSGQGWSDAVTEAAMNPDDAIGNLVGSIRTAGQNAPDFKSWSDYEEQQAATGSHPGDLIGALGNIGAGMDPVMYAHKKKYEDSARNMQNAKKGVRGLGFKGMQYGGVMENPYLQTSAIDASAKSQGGGNNTALRVGQGIKTAGGVVGESLSGMGMGGGGGMGGMMGGGGQGGGGMGSMMEVFGGGEGGGFMDMFSQFGGGSFGGGGAGGGFEHGGRVPVRKGKSPYIATHYYQNGDEVQPEDMPRKATAADLKRIDEWFKNTEMIETPYSPTDSTDNPYYNIMNEIDVLTDPHQRSYEDWRNQPFQYGGIPKAQRGKKVRSYVDSLEAHNSGSELLEHFLNRYPEVELDTIQGPFENNTKGHFNGGTRENMKPTAKIVRKDRRDNDPNNTNLFDGNLVSDLYDKPTNIPKGYKEEYLRSIYNQNGGRIPKAQMGGGMMEMLMPGMGMIKKLMGGLGGGGGQGGGQGGGGMDMSGMMEKMQNMDPEQWKAIQGMFKDGFSADGLGNAIGGSAGEGIAGIVGGFMGGGGGGATKQNGGRLEKTSELPMDMEGFTDLEPGFNRSNTIEINSGNNHSDLDNPHTPLNVPVPSFDEQGNAMTENVQILAEKGEFARKDPETEAVTIFSKNLKTKDSSGKRTNYAKIAEKLGKKEDRLTEQAKNPFDDIADASIQRALSNVKNKFIRLEEEQKVAKEVKEEEDRMDLMQLAKNGGRITKKNTYKVPGRKTSKVLSEYQKDLLGMDDQGQMPMAQTGLTDEEFDEIIKEERKAEREDRKQDRKDRRGHRKRRRDQRKENRKKTEGRDVSKRDDIDVFDQTEDGTPKDRESDLEKEIKDMTPEEAKKRILEEFPPKPPVEEPEVEEEETGEQQQQRRGGSSGDSAINDYINNLRGINAEVEQGLTPYENYFEDYGRETEHIQRNAINDLPEWYMDRASQLASANVNSLENAIRNMGQSMGTSGYLAQMQAAKNKELAANQGYAAQAHGQREQQLGKIADTISKHRQVEAEGATVADDRTREAQDALYSAKYDTEKNILTGRLAQTREDNAARRNELLDSQMQWMYNNDRTQYDKDGNPVNPGPATPQYGGKIKRDMYEYGSRVKRERQMKSDKAINEFRSFMRGFNKK